MPDPVPSHRVTRPRTLALGAVAAIVISATAIATSGHRLPGAVTVDYIPPDACVAFYGPGPCREHGLTIIGSTDAVALWRAPTSAPRPEVILDRRAQHG